MASFLAAAIQMNSQPDLDHNLDRARHLINQAADKGATLIGLPENFAFLGDEPERLRLAGEISEAVETALQSWSAEFGVHLLAGGYPVRAAKDKVFNRAVLVNPNGKFISRYDKIHLFDVELSEKESYRESEWVRPGELQPVVCNVPNLTKIGLSICYDVRFPELYRKLTELGARVLTVPSAFTRPTGEAHWEVLLRARAIENTAYVFAPAQTGKHGRKRTTYGYALIADPWGTVLADAGTEPGVALAEIDLGRLESIRKKLPSLSHRVL
ncbi:MAG: carbon-nitrogen hydrolase family protein [Balneolaceae bacterium]